MYRQINGIYPNVITFIKIIDDYNTRSAIVVNIDIEEFTSAFDSTGENQLKYIIENDSTILYAEDKTLLFKNADDMGIFVNFYKNDVYSELGSEYYDWKYVCVTRFDEYREEMLNSISNVFFISLGIFVLFILFGIILADESAKPIKTVANVFKDIEGDSIEEISDHEVEYIVSNIMNLINKNKKLENELRYELECVNKIHFTALQFQINPHFLYNTLNSISIKTRKENLYSKVPKMIKNLAALMRVSLNNRDNLITGKENEDTVVTTVIPIVE